MRSIFFLSVTFGSSMTGLNAPFAMSSIEPDAASARSSDFGVITTSGTGFGELACWRKQMIVVARRRGIRDAQVAFGGELQEALEPRARMFRPLAFVAVRQQQRQARGLTPLRLTRGDELIDDDLRAVDEVAELRFPQHQRLRHRRRVAVFETDARVFRKRPVVNLEARLRLPRDAAAARIRCCVAGSCKTAWRWLNVPRSVS